MMEIITKSIRQTIESGKILGEEILRDKRLDCQNALVLALSGNLGSGKTIFTQGLARGLGILQNIVSPTFVIMKQYNIPHPTSNIQHLYHIDCYRIQEKDLLELDFKDILRQSQNIIVIEWAEKVKDILPQNSIWLKFEYFDQDKRKIKIEISNSNQELTNPIWKN